jgi:hypothetical protein
MSQTDNLSWRVAPGSKGGPRKSIEDLLTEGYRAHQWMRESFRREPLERRVQKGRFCQRLSIRRPTVNGYLKGGGIPFPFPPEDHLVFVVDVDDRTLRWVSPSVCDALQHAESELIGRDAHGELRGTQASEPGHRAAIDALVTGTSLEPFHECRTTFVRRDGLWLPVRIRVSYGPLYRVWFIDAQLNGEPIIGERNHELLNTDSSTIYLSGNQSTFQLDSTLQPFVERIVISNPAQFKLLDPVPPVIVEHLPRLWVTPEGGLITSQPDPGLAYVKRRLADTARKPAETETEPEPDG